MDSAKDLCRIINQSVENDELLRGKGRCRDHATLLFLLLEQKTNSTSTVSQT